MITPDLTAYMTLARKEIKRILRIWPQTLVPSMITQTLYFVIFGNFIGSRVGEVGGVSYMAFIVPGLVMMAVINNAYTNVSGSFFSSKFQRNIEELLVSPAPSWVIVCGYMSGGMFRANIVGLLVFIISCLFTHPQIHHLGIIILFTVLTSAVFALAGLLNGIFARSFDDVTIFPTFVLTPLTYLGGVFYSIKDLPVVWQNVSALNPILYMVNGFRYGFYGISDVDVMASFLVICAFIIVLVGAIFYFLHKGIGLKN